MQLAHLVEFERKVRFDDDRQAFLHHSETGKN